MKRATSSPALSSQVRYIPRDHSPILISCQPKKAAPVQYGNFGGLGVTPAGPEVGLKTARHYQTVWGVCGAIGFTCTLLGTGLIAAPLCFVCPSAQSSYLAAGVSLGGIFCAGPPAMVAAGCAGEAERLRMIAQKREEDESRPRSPLLEINPIYPKIEL